MRHRNVLREACRDAISEDRMREKLQKMLRFLIAEIAGEVETAEHRGVIFRTHDRLLMVHVYGDIERIVDIPDQIDIERGNDGAASSIVANEPFAFENA